MAVRNARTLLGVSGFLWTVDLGSRSGLIGLITLDVNCAGARSAGNPLATCDVAGAGNQLTVRIVRHSQRKRGATDRPDLRSNGASPRPYRQFAALLIFISLGLSATAFGFAGAKMAPPARLVFTLVVEHFLIATTMLVVGLFAVLSWDSTFPDRRDVLVLAPLPVRARTMFLAKVAADRIVTITEGKGL